MLEYVEVRVKCFFEISPSVFHVEKVVFIGSDMRVNYPVPTTESIYIYFFFFCIQMLYGI